MLLPMRALGVNLGGFVQGRYNAAINSGSSQQIGDFPRSLSTGMQINHFNNHKNKED